MMDKDRSLLTICRFGGEHGWGHITRCSALNARARSMGWKTELVTPSEIDSIDRKLIEAFENATPVDRFDVELMLGGRDELDVVLIDEMYIEDAYYGRARAIIDRYPGARLVAIDDMRQRSLDAAHMTINSELGLREAAYGSDISLLGERYALLRKGIGEPMAIDTPNWGISIPVLVMIGGTDPLGLTDLILEGLLNFESVSFAPIVVSGDGNCRASIEKRLDQFEVSLYKEAIGASELSAWIGACQFGIISCGTSVFEFAARDTPFLGVIVVDNQEAVAGQVGALWNLPIVSGSEIVRSQSILNSPLSRLIGKLNRWSEKSFAAVDLDGAKRVMDAITRL